VLKVLLVHSDLKVRLVLKVLQEDLDQQGQKVHKDQTDQQVPQDHKVHKEHKDLQDLQGRQDQQVLRVLKGLKEQDHKERQGLQVPQDLRPQDVTNIQDTILVTHLVRVKNKVDFMGISIHPTQ
jgi:hypothetical protein